MADRALVLDCDGVLADTERFGHLVAFNQVFTEFGLPVHWSVPDYLGKLQIGGGKERLASLLTPEFVAAARLPADQAGQQQAVAAWHQRKTEIYTGLVASGAVPPRPGIARLVAESVAAGWQVAVAATSAEVSVRASRDRAVGGALAGQIEVFAGDIVPEPCPPRHLPADPGPARPAARCRGRDRGLAQRPARRRRRRAGLHDHRQRLHRRRGFHRSRPGGVVTGRPGRRAHAGAGQPQPGRTR